MTPGKPRHGVSPDVVLINPGSRTRIYQSLGARLTAVENPVWAGLIASFVRQRGYSVEIVDAEADDLSPDQAAARIAELAPRLAVVVVYGHQPSASTQNMTGASAVTSTSPVTRWPATSLGSGTSEGDTSTHIERRTFASDLSLTASPLDTLQLTDPSSRWTSYADRNSRTILFVTF